MAQLAKKLIWYQSGLLDLDLPQSRLIKFVCMCSVLLVAHKSEGPRVVVIKVYGLLLYFTLIKFKSLNI